MRKFVVIGQTRTGSNLLYMSLTQTPGCTMAGEFFNDGCYPFPATKCGKERAYYFYHVLNETRKCVGFKLLADTTRDGPNSSVWDYIEDRDISVIHLVRRNQFKRVLSKLVAAHTDRWLVPTGDDWEFPADFVCDESIAWWENQMRCGVETDQNLVKRYSNNRYLRVFYEDDLAANYKQTIATVQSFLGLQPYETMPKIQRQGTKDPKDYIVNYKKLVDHFSGTQYAEWFG